MLALAVLLALCTSAAAAEKLPAPRAPATAQHTEFVVEVNGKGQVVRIRSGVPSRDGAFNTMTYGNALQVFIRTHDGRAISGLYRLSYDYDPKDEIVTRHVALIRAGGVDPKALGAVDEMKALDRRKAAARQ